ncbi:EPIDERMAL PATTERNING FACTOR-like protein 6 [Sorghum bicolor]|nr:EPIDERMAL PATTERNING FACTOR-like protein 6 [Sorghum bicolor]|eukprot:XP_002447184.1 EPIDERMAL PATTERNING FACTOR-like protein 6 [Sorghum bicolor]
MGRHAGVVLLALTVVLLLAAVGDGIRPAPTAGASEMVHGSTTTTTEMVVVAAPSAAQVQGKRSRGGKDDDLVLREEVVRATGSSLPDCSHACGACSPCSRVMVSFKCSASEPLPCPMVYRCMCRGKCYPVPSS